MQQATKIMAAFVVAGCASVVQVPDRLKPAANESLALVVPAKGDQIYECRANQWVFVAPEADLFDATGKRIGRHYAGPHWEAADGSRIVATVKSRADAPAGECSQAGAQARVAYTAAYYFFTAK